MPKVFKRLRFESAHSLDGYDGACVNIHGHSYNVIIELEGEIEDPLQYETNQQSGMVEDLGVFDPIEDQIADELDHDYLNEYFGDTFRTTAENLALYIFGTTEDILDDLDLPGLKCAQVKLYETERSGVIMDGEDWIKYQEYYEDWKERTQ